MDTIEQLMRKLPPPPPGKSPGVACVVGLLFGGLGLAIYLWNVIDFVFPMLVFVVLSVLIGVDIGAIGGVLFAGAYGYFRVGVFASVGREEPRVQ